MTTHWPPRIAAFLLWALAALSSVYWLLLVVGASEAPITAGAIGAEPATIATADLTRVLGPAVAPTASPSAPTLAPTQPPAIRMQLLGVVSARHQKGVALIAVEGQPARPYRVGSTIADTHRLTRVATRSATLTPIEGGTDAITLELAASAANAVQRPGVSSAPVIAVPAAQPRAAPAPGRATEPAKD